MLMYDFFKINDEDVISYWGGGCNMGRVNAHRVTIPFNLYAVVVRLTGHWNVNKNWVITPRLGNRNHLSPTRSGRTKTLWLELAHFFTLLNIVTQVRCVLPLLFSGVTPSRGQIQHRHTPLLLSLCFAKIRTWSLATTYTLHIHTPSVTLWCRFCVTVLTDFRIGRPTGLAVSRHVSRPRHPTLRFLRKLFTFFRIGPYKLVDLCKWSAFVNNRTMRDNCSAAPRLQHCVEITSVSFTVSAVLSRSRSRLGLEGNCLGLVLVSADSENKCLCLVSVSNTNCLVSVSSWLKLSRTQHW